MPTQEEIEESLFLSTLSLRRATLAARDESIKFVFLSTLSLRRATWARGSRVTYVEFLSTLSLRRATNINSSVNTADKISIHALLAESDLLLSLLSRAVRIFLSTLSLRRATAKVHKTVGHFSAYETNFMGIASSC